MRTRLSACAFASRFRNIALAATLSIVGLAAMPMANAWVPPSGGSGGGGGGGGGHAGGGGGSGGAHFSAGGGGAGGHFSGGGRFSGGSYRGGGGYGGVGYGGSAFHSSYMVHGGYVAHGSYMGGVHPFARGGYRIVGSEPASLSHVTTSTISGGLHSARITLALGPRMGSAATAMRLDHAGRTNRMLPRPGHPPGPKPPRYHAKYVPASTTQMERSPVEIPFFCEQMEMTPPRGEDHSGCLTPTKEHAGRKVAPGL